MGRSKSVPVHKKKDGGRDSGELNSELLGRRTHQESVEHLLEKEIAQQATEGHPGGLIPLYEDEDDDDDRVEGVDDAKMSPPPQQRKKRNLRKIRKKKKNAKKKKVQFVDEAAMVEMIPPEPEILLERVEGNDTTITILEYNDRRRREKGRDGEFPPPPPALFGLVNFLLPQTTLVVNDDDDDKVSIGAANVHHHLPITTVVGATVLWEHYHLPTTAGKSITYGSDDRDDGQQQVTVAAGSSSSGTTGVGKDKAFFDALSLCMKSGLLNLELAILSPPEAADNNKDDTTTSQVCLRVHLTRFCLEVCHANNLPFDRHPFTKRYREADALQLILSALVPDNNNSNTNQTSATDGGGPITAKHVYSLMDNQQIKSALDKKPSTSFQLSIPGLLPKLRGYQTMAVEWMLNREKRNDLGCDEWELAWVVLKTKSGHNPTTGVTITPLPKFQSKLFHTPDATAALDTILLCPLAGWLATSYEDARKMTNGDECHNDGSVVSFRGGLLAESMGLGKTVEVLALILGNKPKEKEEEEAADLPASTADITATTVQRELFAGPSTDFETDGDCFANTPAGQRRVVVSSSSSSSGDDISAKRQIFSTDSNSIDRNTTAARGNTDGNNNMTKTTCRKVGVVDDMNEFGDADDSSESDEQDDEFVVRQGEGSDSRDKSGDNNWIQCSHCQKWRLLMGGDSLNLPDKWDCSMNVADPHNSSCAAPERNEEWYAKKNYQVGDTDDDDVEDADEASSEEGVISDATPSMPNGSTSSRRQPVPVTPEKAQECSPVVVAASAIKEEWIDEDVIGSCICGDLICFSTTKKSGSVVVCRSCLEPMHRECAGFDSDLAMRCECTEPMNIRQRFLNKTVHCHLCSKDKCPTCFAAEGSLQTTGATLIITPPAILDQWDREIRRHARQPDRDEALKVVVYEGLRVATSNRKSKAVKLLHPRFLADADIVLITYDALLVDLGHSNDNKFLADELAGSSNLRKRKRYRVVPSPLTSIRWWRVCLDEAQRVETPTAASARMALKLEAEHRWVVTGTPIGRGKLEDLYGLLLFLRVQPFANKSWFRKCLTRSHNKYGQVIEETIYHLLRNIFWRSTKSFDLVREQMGVPEQVEKKIKLRQSSIETHFYKQQLEQTFSAVGVVVRREKDGKKRKASQLDILAESLHRLRAACLHPQVGSSGIGGKKKLRTASSNGKKSSIAGSTSSATSVHDVMTMEQIGDRLIDNGKLKCEEALRLTLMNTNAMGAIKRLQIEAKERGVNVRETDANLLVASCKHYMESLKLSEEYAVPTLVKGEAVLTGSTGFADPRMIIRDGASNLHWKQTTVTQRPMCLWSQIDFELSRKVTQIRMRPVLRVPLDVTGETSNDFEWHILYPKECVFQVSAAAVAGEFIDVASFSIPDPSAASHTTGVNESKSWIVQGGFRTNKSQTWRLLVKNFHQQNGLNKKAPHVSHSVGVYVGIELELYEAAIASDSLQRLHSLHNAAISFESLFAALDKNEGESIQKVHQGLSMSKPGIKDKIKVVTEEALKIESLYMEHARSVHKECKRRLEDAMSQRKEKERSLFDLNNNTSNGKAAAHAGDCWDDGWWDDFLVMVHLYGDEMQKRNILERLLQDLDGYILNRYEAPESTRGTVKFPEFRDINGFRTAINSRIRDIRTGLGKERSRKSQITTACDLSDTFVLPRDNRFKCPSKGHAKCMKKIVSLSQNPSGEELFENSHCHVCKEDFNQTGPKCRHCKLGEELEELTPDKVTITALTAVCTIVRSSLGAAVVGTAKAETAHVGDRAKRFFDVLEAEKREMRAGWRAWRIHLDLMNDVDELLQCKSSMRLTYEGEDVTQLTDEQLNAVIVPIDLVTKYHDYAAKQAMTLGELGRAKQTLGYLKTQNGSNNTSKQAAAGRESSSEEKEKCIVCLEPFNSERSVLRCGHSFHLHCVENLKKYHSRGLRIKCPMRCKVETDPKDVMIASSKRKDDGSLTKRQVKGSWGTKVERIVSDILDTRDRGDKGIVFSQWEDMLDIFQHALTSNGVNFVRATSLKKIGEITRQFRSPECVVMLLNVKNGAEGLTLLEATHVFMVEPLLNCGLDSQAINRIHRIGQNRKTYVWRYLVEDTIEMKIDKLRMEHQEDQLEDSINEGRKSVIKAGGIDGGFSSQEEIFDLLGRS